MNAPALPDDFRDFLFLLNQYEVRFVLVGAHALGWHGVVRATGDIDFLFEQTADNVRRLCDTMREFGAPPFLIDPAFMMQPDAVVQLGNEPLRVDLLSSISGVTFEDAFTGAHDAVVDGLPVKILGLQELRRNKSASGREKDLSDLRRLNARHK